MTGLQDDARIEQLLDGILATPAHERQMRLDDVARDSPDCARALRERLASLLRFGLLEPPGGSGTLTEGATFGGYRIVREIASGGMGTVYLAWQPAPLERPVALKVIRADRVHDPASRERFAREVQVLTRFAHPVFCPVYDAGLVAGHPYLAMRYVDGDSLADRIDAARRGGGPQAGIATVACGSDGDDGRDAATPASRDNSQRQVFALVALFEKIASGLAALHAAGFVHRDLKPSNVLVDAAGEPIVLDFGLAHCLEGDSLLTTSSTPVGTPAYMAPEQVRGRAVDARTDVYGLGATLYECLLLRPPFLSTDREALYHEIVAVVPPEPRRHNRHVPRDLSVVVAKCLEKDPQRRYATAAALAADLAAVRVGKPVSARPPGPVRRLLAFRRQQPLLAGVLLALLVLVGVGAGFLEAKVRALRREHGLSLAYQSGALLGRDPPRARELALQAKELLGADPALSDVWLSRLWNARAADRQRARWDLPVGAFACHWSPTGDRLLCLLNDGSFVLLDRDGVRRGEGRTTHPDGIRPFPLCCAAWAPSGEWFALATYERRLSLHRHSDAERIGAEIVLPDRVNGYFPIGRGDTPLAFSADGSQFVVLTESGTMHRFAVPSLQPIGDPIQAQQAWGTLLGRPSPTATGANTGSDEFLTTDLRHGARLWGFDGRERRAFPVGPVTAACFSADGRHLALGRRNGVVVLFDLQAGTDGRELVGLSREVTALTFLGDGSGLVAAGFDQHAMLWDSNGNLVRMLSPARASPFWAAAATPDGERFALSALGKVDVFDRGGNLLETLRGHRDMVVHLALQPDTGRLTSTGWDGTVRIWELQDPYYRLLAGHRHVVTAAEWLDGGRLLSVSLDGDLRSWDLVAGTNAAVPAPRLRGNRPGLWSLAVTRDGRHAVTGDFTGHIQFWDIPAAAGQAPQPSRPTIGDMPIVKGARYSPCERYVLTTSNNEVVIWTAAGELVRRIDVGHYEVTMAVMDRAEPPRIAAISQFGLYDLWDFDGRRLQPTVDLGEYAWSIEFAQDSAHVLLSLQSGRAVLARLDGRVQVEYRGHSANVMRAAFSPGQQHVLTAAYDGTIKIWRAQGGEPIATLEHGAPVLWGGFSPDGRHVFSCGADGLIRTWPNPAGDGSLPW